jgi:hypothetical protein
VALLRYSMLNILAEIYETRLEKEASVVRLRASSAQGGTSQEEVDACLSRVCDELLAEVRRDGSPFVISFVRAMLEVRETRLRREILGVESGDSSMSTVFHDAVDSAGTEVELQTIAILVDMLGLGVKAADGLDESDAAAKARKMMAGLDARIKQKHLDATGRGLDWTGWDLSAATDDAESEEASKGTATAPAASRPAVLALLAAVPMWVWVAGVGAGMTATTVFAACVVAIIMRNTRVPAKRGRGTPVLPQ